MVTSLKDEDGKIVCYCEWRLVGKSGFDKVNGEYIWVNDLWVHPKYERTSRINRIIDEVMRMVPSATHCYFKREKYNGRIKMFSREFWQRRRQSYEPINTVKEI